MDKIVDMNGDEVYEFDCEKEGGISALDAICCSVSLVVISVAIIGLLAYVAYLTYF